jgi:hypothetical protein
MQVSTFSRSLAGFLLLLVFIPTALLAFNPPVDTAGPLRVRIEGPETIAETETPFPVSVVLENRGSRAVKGDVRLRLIDRWRCEPAGAVEFHVGVGESKAIEFRVTAGQGTYAAHYPIHALARFSGQDGDLIAHPILILEAKVPAPAAQRDPLTWQPFVLGMDRQLALWQLPVYRAGLQVLGQQSQMMPAGWTGSETETRASFSVGSEQRLGDQTRTVVAIHPPWAEGRVGTAWIEFPLAMPQASKIRLGFANAVTASGDGDGVTFRVRVLPADAPSGELGEVVFERHSNAKTWVAGEADLSRFAGRKVRLQLESHPGPKNNTAFDQSYWAEPTLIAGTPPLPRPFPPQDAGSAISLGRLRIGDGDYDVRVWPGSRGLLDADVGLLAGDRQLFFRGFRVQVLGQRLDDPKTPVTLVDVVREDVEDGCRMRHRFSGIHGSFDLVVQLACEAGGLKTAFRLENAPPQRPWFAPRIESLSIDSFNQPVARVYAGHGNVIQRPAAFRLNFDGHRLATSHVGFDFENGLSLVQAVDLPPESLVVEPDGHHYSLHTTGEATFTLIPAADVWDAARHYRETCGWQAAAGVPHVAGRFVFDLWGGRYGQSGDALRRAFRYGLTDATVIWHNWQRWGYDYRLPEIYPPNPQLGTEAELVAMTEACRAAGVQFALHDNYIDLYPDAEGFSYEQNIAFSADGRPVRAWFNQGRDAQSYRYRADRVAPFLVPNLETIHKQLRPTAYFIDVWSSIRPYDYWTADGRFFDSRGTRDSWGEHFAWIRDLLGDHAPQISESGHDQLVGWLDGAQANHLRVDRPVPGHYYSWSVWDIRCDDAQRIPWLDFAHHDRFVLHGAGYSGRYQAGLDARLHGIYSDDYIATEVLTGHPAMVSSPFGRDVVRKYWLTQDLMRALALRKIDQVEFVDGDLHRQHVRWSGGGDVWVNRGTTDWTVEDHVLPPFGFLARVATGDGPVQAAIHRRDGLIVESTTAAGHLYVNGRQMAGGPRRIRPDVVSTAWTSPRRIEWQIEWQADDPIPDGYRPFLHLVDAKGEIAFQATYDAAVLAERRSGQIRMRAMADVPEGSRPDDQWELRVGLYHPAAGGSRLEIQGPDDGERRIRLGTVRLTGDGARADGLRWTAIETGPDAFLARNNPQSVPVDFGPIVTAGGCRLVRDGNTLLLIPLPDSGSAGTEFTVRWDRLPGKLPRPTRIETLSEDDRILHTAPAGDTLGQIADNLGSRPHDRRPPVRRLAPRTTQRHLALPTRRDGPLPVDHH